MKIRGSTPKEVEYIYTLYFELDNPGFVRRALQRVRGRQDRYTKSELAEIIGTRKEDPHARCFLDTLIEQGVLEDAGKRAMPRNQVPVWTVNRKRLLAEFIESGYFEQNKDLFASALHETEEVFKFG